MAKVDIKGPSADEDFDVKADDKAADTSVADTSTDTSSEADTSSTSTETTEATEAPADVNLSSEESSETDSSSSDTSEEAPAEESTDSTVSEAATEPASSQIGDISGDVTTAATTTPKGGSNVGRTIVDIILVAIIIGLAIWGYGMKQDRDNLADQVSKQQANPQALVQKQADAIITRVSKLMNLPSGETPTIANVTDANAAKQQSAFFNNAQNGDKVLMYVKAGEAILYRPSTNKIILVAPLTFNNSAATTGTTR